MKLSPSAVFQYVAGIVLVAVGGFLSATGVGAPIGGGLITVGAGLMVGGVITQIASFLATTPSQPNQANSPTYGFQQWQNPVGEDRTIPVIYSNDTADDLPGHKVAPVYVQAYTTPRGHSMEEKTTAVSRGQSMSVLLALGEGPIVGISDIRINDEPVFDQVTAKALGTGNGSAKRFAIGRRVNLKSVRIYIDGTLKGWKQTRRTELIGKGTNTATTNYTYTSDCGDYERIDDAADILWYYGTSQKTPIDISTGTTGLRPHAWMETPTRLIVNTQQPLELGWSLWASIPYLTVDGGGRIYEASDGTAYVEFASAPSSGAKVTADYLRQVFAGIDIEWRNGAEHQSPISGYDAVRNTIGVSKSLEYAADDSDEREFTTTEAVDDVTIDIASVGGFTAYDKSGDHVATHADVRIRWKMSTEPDTAFRVLEDPKGSADGNKKATEFRLNGNNTSGLFWSFSLRNILERLAERKGNKQSVADLAALKHGKITVRVKRTSKVGNNTNSQILDSIELLSYQMIRFERLSYPGTALMSVTGVGSERLQGGLPQITCRVQGRADVEYYTGTAWVASETAQSNPVWAMIDMITARRYGGGEQFTKASHIDTASALTAAAWCDAFVTRADKTVEKRAVLDVVIDTRNSLMALVRDNLAPAQIVPVLRGNVWHFLVDQAVTLADCPVIYDDGGDDARTAKGSLVLAHPPITSQVTEIQCAYLDRDDDWDRAEVWVSPQASTDDRRIERVSAFGVTRSTQATEYAKFLQNRGSRPFISLSWSMTPGGLRLESGDVVRVISTRLGCDLYARIMRTEVDSTDSWVVRIEASEYVPEVYGQDATKSAVTKPTTGAANSVALTGSAMVGKKTATGEPVAGSLIAVMKRVS